MHEMRKEHIIDLLDTVIPSHIRDERPEYNTVYYKHWLIAVVKHSTRLVCIRPSVAKLLGIKDKTMLRGYTLIKLGTIMKETQGKYERYEHHGKMVWVNKELKGKHREHCLCFNCENFSPRATTNCRIALDNYETCVKNNTVQPVYECPNFKELS